MTSAIWSSADAWDCLDAGGGLVQRRFPLDQGALADFQPQLATRG